MKNGLRDLVIFILLVCFGLYIWHNRNLQPEPQKKKSRVEMQKKASVSQKKTYKKKFNLSYSAIVQLSNAGVEELSLVIPIPVSLPLKQNLTEIKYSKAPTKFLSHDDSKFAVYKMKSPQKGETKVTMSSAVLVKRYDYQHAQQNTSSTYALENKMRYLKSEDFIETTSSIVQNTANNISGNSTIEVLQAISDYMAKNLNLQIVSGATIGAEKTLKNQAVEIGDYANTFVALCRAKRIPARVVSGYRIAESDGMSSHHAWAEVFFPKYGWVTIDPYSRRGSSISETDYFYVVFANNSFSNYDIKYTFKENTYIPSCKARVEVDFTPAV